MSVAKKQCEQFQCIETEQCFTCKKVNIANVRLELIQNRYISLLFYYPQLQKLKQVIHELIKLSEKDFDAEYIWEYFLPQN